jgi:hypothetical protein
MAAPHVAGVAARLLAGAGSMTAAELKSKLLGMGTEGLISEYPSPADVRPLLHMDCMETRKKRAQPVVEVV